jgi:Tfp pilus assembly protein PilN
MKNQINLLPWKCRQQQVFRLRLMQWIIPWGFVIGFVLTTTVVQLIQYNDAHERVRRLEKACDPLADLRRKIDSLQKTQTEVARREAILAGLENPRPALSLLGLVSQSASKCKGRLHIEHLATHSLDASPAAAGRPSAGATAFGGATKGLPKPPAPTTTMASPPTMGLAIRGVAADNVAVSTFVVALRKTNAFEKVELKSSQEKTTDDRRTCSYLVECVY